MAFHPRSQQEHWRLLLGTVNCLLYYLMTKIHRIDYIEFCVSDIAASKRFYAQVFGWEFTDYAPTYAGIRGEDGEIGGFAQVDAATPPSTPDTPPSGAGSTLAVLHCEALEEVRQKVLDAGGVITQDIFSFPGGRRFEFTAPGGSRAAVWSETPAD